jgi:hypothetical protein
MVPVDGVKRRRREKRRAAVYQYQKDSRYFARIADSLKEAGAKELAELGAEDIRPEFNGKNRSKPAGSTAGWLNTKFTDGRGIIDFVSKYPLVISSFQVLPSDDRQSRFHVRHDPDPI